MTDLVIRGAQVGGRTVDIRVTGGRVSAVGAELPRSPRAQVLEARGGALLPGLYDSHVHLTALAAETTSVRCGPPAVPDAPALAAALGGAAPDVHGWIRGLGYTDSVAGDLDAAALDRLHGARPVRVQHRSGALWILNSAGADRLGLPAGDHPGIERMPDGTPTGRLWRADDWLRSRLPRPQPPDLAAYEGSSSSPCLLEAILAHFAFSQHY